jgi:hypothetical protein
MSDHIDPIIKKIYDFNINYYTAWAIETREALKQYSWMRWIDSTTRIKEIKEENESDIDNIEGLHIKALLSQSIGYKHKSKIRDCTIVVNIWFTLEDKFVYKFLEGK